MELCPTQLQKQTSHHFNLILWHEVDAHLLEMVPCVPSIMRGGQVGPKQMCESLHLVFLQDLIHVSQARVVFGRQLSLREPPVKASTTSASCLFSGIFSGEHPDPGSSDIVPTFLYLSTMLYTVL